jgi:very-short-patch-repair endonuclease
VPRTLLDLARLASPRVLQRACDQAEVLRVLDMSAMRELLARREGQPGVRRLRAVFETGQVGEGIARSELEQRFLRLCRRGDLPLPEVNVSMTVRGEEMQVDFLWRRHRVIVEVDGFRTHGTRQAFQRDRRRDQLATLAGWHVIRFTWDDVTQRPEHVMEVMRAVLAWA